MLEGQAHLWGRNGGVEAMAMPQRDDPPTPRLRRTGTIEAIKRLEPPSRVRYGVSGALLEYAVMHGDEAERKPNASAKKGPAGALVLRKVGGRGAPALPARG